MADALSRSSVGYRAPDLPCSDSEDEEDPDTSDGRADLLREKRNYESAPVRRNEALASHTPYRHTDMQDGRFDTNALEPPKYVCRCQRSHQVEQHEALPPSTLDIPSPQTGEPPVKKAKLRPRNQGDSNSRPGKEISVLEITPIDQEMDPAEWISMIRQAQLDDPGCRAIAAARSATHRSRDGR